MKADTELQNAFKEAIDELGRMSPDALHRMLGDHMDKRRAENDEDEAKHYIRSSEFLRET